MNYVIGKSGFGDYWIGKTPKPVKGKLNFQTFEDAKEEALSRNDSIENQSELNVEEEDYFCDDEERFLRKAMYRWLI